MSIMKNMGVGAVLVFASACAVSARAESEALWGWNVSAGGNFGFGLKTDLHMSPANAMRNMPSMPVSKGSRATTAAERKLKAGQRVAYGNGYFVDPDSTWGEASGNPSETWNWKLPDSAANREQGAFVLDGGEWGGEWIDQTSSSQAFGEVSDSDSSVMYGASVEFSHGLFISEDAKWGLDIAIGLTWMKARDCFRASGVAVTRNAQYERGTSATVLPGDFFDYPYAQAEDDGSWGNGTRDGSDFNRAHYTLDMNDVSTVYQSYGSQSYSDSMTINAHGDYEEWEISALLRPWYDINEWMCVHAAVGLGVTRSSFEYQMEALSGGQHIYRSSQEISEWRCYGIAGAGVLFRVWDFDLSCDGLFRWCQQDMEINSQDINGRIEKPWGVVRVGLSYAF